MWLHWIGAVFIYFTTLFYGIYGYLKIGRIFEDVHGPLGVVITILVTFIFLSGVITRKLLQRDERENQISL